MSRKIITNILNMIQYFVQFTNNSSLDNDSSYEMLPI